MSFWSRYALRINRARRAWLIRATSGWTGWSDRLFQQSDSWAAQKIQ